MPLKTQSCPIWATKKWGNDPNNTLMTYLGYK